MSSILCINIDFVRIHMFHHLQTFARSGKFFFYFDAIPYMIFIDEKVMVQNCMWVFIGTTLPCGASSVAIRREKNNPAI